MKTEWYHSVFMIHHPKRVGPTNDKVFGLLLDDCSITQKLKILSLDDGNWKHNFGVSMTKTCCSSIVTGGFFFLFLLHAFFFFPCLFLRLLLISFLFPSPISFLNFVLFLSLFLLSRFVGLSSTFYRFLCLFLYFFFVFLFFVFFVFWFFFGGFVWYFLWYLMVISRFWSDLWVWSSGLRCHCGVWIFEMWLWVWVWVWGSDFVVWLWWFESKMWLWVSVWGLDLWCGCGGFGFEMWWPFLSLPLWVWVHVCMFKTVLICFRFDFQIWWLLGREIKEEDDTCREKNERGIEREKILRVWTFVVLLPFWLMGSTTFE